MKDVKQKPFSFNAESSVIELFRNLVSLLFVFFSWLPFGRLKQDEHTSRKTLLKVIPTTPFSLELLFFHSQSQTREKMQ